jgi:hypothetical protein
MNVLVKRVLLTALLLALLTLLLTLSMPVIVGGAPRIVPRLREGRTGQRHVTSFSEGSAHRRSAHPTAAGA